MLKINSHKNHKKESMKSLKFISLASLMLMLSLTALAQKEESSMSGQTKPGSEQPKPGDPAAQVRMIYINVTAVSNVKGVCSDILLNVGLDENVPEAVGKRLPEVLKRAKNNVMTFLDIMNNVGFKVINVTSEKDGETVYTHYLLMQSGSGPGGAGAPGAPGAK